MRNFPLRKKELSKEGPTKATYAVGEKRVGGKYAPASERTAIPRSLRNLSRVRFSQVLKDLGFNERMLVAGDVSSGKTRHGLPRTKPGAATLAARLEAMAISQGVKAPLVHMLAGLPINQSALASSFNIAPGMLERGAAAGLKAGLWTEVEILEGIAAKILQQHGGPTPGAIQQLSKAIQSGSIKQALLIGLSPAQPGKGIRPGLPWPTVHIASTGKNIPFAPFPRRGEISYAGLQQIGQMKGAPDVRTPMGVARQIMANVVESSKHGDPAGAIKMKAAQLDAMVAGDVFALEKFQTVRPQVTNVSGVVHAKGIPADKLIGHTGEPLVRVASGRNISPGVGGKLTGLRTLMQQPGTLMHSLFEPIEAEGITTYNPRGEAAMQGKLGRAIPRQAAIAGGGLRTLEIAKQDFSTLEARRISTATNWEQLVASDPESARAARDAEMAESRAALRKGKSFTSKKIPGGLKGGAAVVALLIGLQFLLSQRQDQETQYAA